MRMVKKKNTKKLVFVGGGHAHLTCLKNLDSFIKRGHTVTVVSSGEYHYYSGMGPGMLSSIYEPQEIRFNIKKLVESRGGSFIAERVIRIDPKARRLLLSNGTEIEYDIASFNTGSEVSGPLLDTSQEKIYPVKPIEKLYTARCTIVESLREGSLHFVIVGGGPAGVEIACNLCELVKKEDGQATITLISGMKILNRFDPKTRSLAMKKMREKKISVIEDAFVKKITSNTITLENGSSISFDFAFIATGVKPSSLFKDSGIQSDNDGALLVNEYLQSVQYPQLFGGGDCISFQPHTLDKVGVYAIRQNPILLNNLHAALGNSTLKKFIPQKNYLLILNMGDGTGVFFRKSLVCSGRKAFWLKNYIDTQFTKKFQLFNERNESVECSHFM
jgi:NADH dehydrogenase FAD-containing subunit